MCLGLKAQCSSHPESVPSSLHATAQCQPHCLRDLWVSPHSLLLHLAKSSNLQEQRNVPHLMQSKSAFNCKMHLIPSMQS